MGNLVVEKAKNLLRQKIRLNIIGSKSLTHYPQERGNPGPAGRRNQKNGNQFLPIEESCVCLK